MLRSAGELQGYSIGATDGHIGHIKDLYFDDDAWVIRYLVVYTGSWLLNRKVLISPISVHSPSWVDRMLPVSITMEQVRNSPDIDTDKSVSRQHEIQYFAYFGYPGYWGSSETWGLYPHAMAPAYADEGFSDKEQLREQAAYTTAEADRHRNDDPHLRSYEAVMGYAISAMDGEIGHVEDMLVDDETWAIRYFVVNTGNWWLGHKVLVAPQWIRQVSWIDESAKVDLSRESVRGAPVHDSTAELNRQHEAGLYEHHGRPGYWVGGALLEPEI